MFDGPRELHDFDRMTLYYHVWLRDPLTGDTRMHRSGGFYDREHFDYMWEDGNYACDCNRSMFLWPGDESKHLDCKSDRIVVDRVEGPFPPTEQELEGLHSWIAAVRK